MKIIKIGAIWCSACLKMNNYYSKLQEEFPNLEIISYDIDFDEEEAKKYPTKDVLPALFFYQDDKLITRLDGEKTYDEIKEILNKME